MAPILASISQVIIKWQTNQAGQLPEEFADKAWFLLEFLIRPWVLFAMFATFASGVSWIIAMTKLDLSYAYPYVAASFIVVPLLAVFILGESFTTPRLIGGILILSGIAVVMIKG
jgi:drug/metabolite transporter (DMT)-like permease